MQQYYKQGELEIGLDEAGRGSLLGPVFTAGVILNDIQSNPPPYEIKDSNELNTLFEKFKDLADIKHEIYDDDLHALISNTYNDNNISNYVLKNIFQQ